MTYAATVAAKDQVVVDVIKKVQEKMEMPKTEIWPSVVNYSRRRRLMLMS